MRSIPPSLQASLDSGATTLSRCWRIDRADGVTLGFTDHDRALELDGVTFEAQSGFNSGALEQSTGLSTDNHEITGALKSEAITARDIEKGLYDGAEVTLFLVDWTNTADRIVLSAGLVGEIRRSGKVFEAEILGLSEKLNQPVGRAYLYSCDLRLGEAKCGVDLSDPTYRGTGTVIQIIDPGHLVISGLETYEDGWFTAGFVDWISGENAGLSGDIRSHVLSGTSALIELWLPTRCPVALGDTLAVVAGCDKRLQTCRDKFANLVNFRGFPHMPGDDFATSYPNRGGAHDGGSLFRS